LDPVFIALTQTQDFGSLMWRNDEKESEIKQAVNHERLKITTTITLDN